MAILLLALAKQELLNVAKWVSFLALFAFFPVPHKIYLTAANRNAFILLALVCAPSNFCVSGILAASAESKP